MTRRAALAGVLSLLIAGCGVAGSRREREIRAQLAAIQSRLGGRLGVYALDTGSRLAVALNDSDRFAMCSTFKLLLAAAVLTKADTGTISLDQTIRFGRADMLSHAPVTSTRLASGAMTVGELCAAVVEVSDNPAANLLLSLIDGPAGLTRFLRRIGDDTTRLDRTELSLNTNLPGDPRDTTTPRAMVQTMEKVLIGDMLSRASRVQLLGWLSNSTTGAGRIRAGLPADWRAGDKTGAGANGAVNDVAIVWPPGRAPILAAIYMSESPLPLPALEEAHAEIGRLIPEM